MLNGYDPNLIEPGRLTVPAILKSRGYYTAGIGKWHLELGDRPIPTTTSRCGQGRWITASTTISGSRRRWTWIPIPAMLRKKGKPLREAVVHHSNLGMFGIRQGNWKSEFGLGSGRFSDLRIEEPKPGAPKGQLYDLASDPAVQNALWLDRPAEVARLTALLEGYKQQAHSRTQ